MQACAYFGICLFQRMTNFIRNLTIMPKRNCLKIGSLLAFLSLQNLCFSQAGNFSMGIHAGISVPNLKASGDNPVSKGWSSRLGPYAGAVGAFNLSEHISFLAEINYASQGGKKNGTQAIPTSDFADHVPPGIQLPPYVYANYKGEVKLNYIELPVLAEVKFPVSDLISLFINAGPYAGYLINAKNVTSGASNIYFDENLAQPLLPSDVSFDQTSDIKPDLKNFNWGIQGGIGLDFRVFDGSTIVLTAGGNYGLIKIQKDKANGENNTGAATVTLGYLIQL